MNYHLALTNDFDRLYPFDPTLRECKYLYRAGGFKEEANRYYFLPDDFLLYYPSWMILGSCKKKEIRKCKNHYIAISRRDVEDLGLTSDFDVEPRTVQLKFYEMTRGEIRRYGLNPIHARFYHQVRQVDDVHVLEFVAPDGDALRLLILESQIYQHNGMTTNAQIRRNYDMIYQYSERDLDKIELKLDN